MGMVAGAVVQIGSSLYTAHAQALAAARNAAIERYNAQIADLQATQALAQGEAEAAQVGSKARLLVGDQRAAYAAQGIDVNSGSAAEVQQATVQLSKRDIDTVRLNAMRAAWGYKTRSLGLEMRADGIMAAGTDQANATILNGVASAVSSFARGASG